MSDNNGILLKGLDGSNPLAFLAALGTLRSLTSALPDETVKMSWEQYEGAWRPRVWPSQSEADIIAALSEVLVNDRSLHPTRFVGDPEQINDFYQSIRSGESVRDGADQWFAALANDVHPRATNQLQTTRRDYFSGNIDQILRNSNKDALQRTLFQAWRYDDKLDGQSLHLEPTEDRRHAYQWYKPNGDPNRKTSGNMLGANRLAIEALPLFLGLPSTNPDRLFVTGWSGVRSDNSRWTWPIWTPQISLESVRSVMELSELQLETPGHQRLLAQGIAAVFRCRRILVEQTPNLTPSVAIV